MPSIFFLVLPLPGRHTTDRTLTNVDATRSGLFADLLSSNPVPEGLSNRGQRQERPELITVLVDKAREKCCHQTDSYRYLLRERSREIDRKVDHDQHACFNNSWRSRIYASVGLRAAEVALTSHHRVPKSLHLIDRLRKVGSCEALRPWKIARPPLFFPTTKWRKKSQNSVTVHL